MCEHTNGKRSNILFVISTILAWLLAVNANCIFFLQMMLVKRVLRRKVGTVVVLCSVACLTFLVPDIGLKRAASTTLTTATFWEYSWKYSNDRSPVMDKYVKPRFVQKYNRLWQMVDPDVGIYLFSAFYDDRHSSLESPTIRTIAVLENGTYDSLSCLLWFGNNVRPVVANVTMSQIGGWFEPEAGVFCSVILSCAVGTQAGRPALIPEHVSIVTATQTAPTTLLRVQVPEKPERPMAFGHCMPVAFWYQDPYRIVEWMELHRMWGVEEVTIYNSSLDPMAMRVYRHYANKSFVDLREAPCAVPAHPRDREAIILSTPPILNDCMYRNMYRYRRLVVTDLNEMIVPRFHDNYTAMLEAIDAEFSERQRKNTSRLSEADQRDTNPTVPAQVSPLLSYVFNNVYFFSDFNVTTQTPWYSPAQQYTRHVAPSPPWYSVKSIHNPLACLGLQNHYCWAEHEVNGKRPVTKYALKWMGMNHHYKKCHYDTYLRKPGMCKRLIKMFDVDLTIARFRKELESRVRVVLIELGMI